MVRGGTEETSVYIKRGVTLGIDLWRVLFSCLHRVAGTLLVLLMSGRWKIIDQVRQVDTQSLSNFIKRRKLHIQFRIMPYFRDRSKGNICFALKLGLIEAPGFGKFFHT